MTRVTLLTDFGTVDGYVAAMKGVLAALAPEAHVEDASHDIPPGDVRAAAWALDGYWQLYPPGSVHVVVVDPGVGTERRALVVSAAGRCFVGPDNGVFSRVLRAVPDAGVYALRIPADTMHRISATFHGRDVFAPAAADLVRGAEPASMGESVADPIVIVDREPARDGGVIRGVVAHVDRFGNLVTNVPGSWVAADATVRIGSATAKVVATYGDVEAGELLALTGSRGLLEVAVRNGSAAERLWTSRELEVHITTAQPEPLPAGK